MSTRREKTYDRNNLTGNSSGIHCFTDYREYMGNQGDEKMIMGTRGMDRQDEALKLLKDIRHINHLIERLQEQIDEIYTNLTNATVKPKEIDVQTSLPSDPMADKVIKAIEYQKQLQDYQSDLIERKTKALNVIKQMNIDNQQLLLLRYFKGYSVEEVGQNTGYTYRWAWEKIHQAEEDFIAIYEKTT